MASESHDVEITEYGINLHCPETEKTVLSHAADPFSHCPYCSAKLEGDDE